MFGVVVEFELISHEILLMHSNCGKLTNEWMMEHHKTNMHQELGIIEPLYLMPMSPVFLTLREL